MKKDDFRDYLEDIVKNMELAVEFCSTVDFDEFDKDIMRSYAVVRCLQTGFETPTLISHGKEWPESEIRWFMITTKSTFQ